MTKEQRNYIAQCDCPEIQNNWKVQEGDYYYHGGYGCCLFVTDVRDVTTTAIWLPKQDQLQRMMKAKADKLLIELVNYLQDNQKFYKNGRVKKLYLTGSMEQLWLAFVMKEKFGKVWVKGKWKNINKNKKEDG
jgi:hypothetical protein